MAWLLLLNQHDSPGAWLIHVVLIVCGKICIDTIPGMTQQISWTLVNLLYLTVRPLALLWEKLPTPPLPKDILLYVPLGHRHPVR